MPRIFISYRTKESQSITGRLANDLKRRFGNANVFMDVYDIRGGRDFRAVLKENLDRCDVMLVIIGKQWITMTDQNGNRLLDKSDDFVRIEVETGLNYPRVKVIPILVDNASIPNESELPKPLQNLAYRQAEKLRLDPDYNNDLKNIISEVDSSFSRLLPIIKHPIVVFVEIIFLALIFAGVITWLVSGGSSQNQMAMTDQHNTRTSEAQTLGAIQNTNATQTAAALTQQASTQQANAAATMAARQTADLTVTAIIDMLTQRAYEAATQTATAIIANDAAATAVSALETNIALTAQSISLAETQAAIGQTATAESWTDTPTVTLTPSVTPIPTETPTPSLTPTLTPTATPAAPSGMSATLVTVEGQAFYVQPRAVSNAEFKAFAMSSFYAGLIGTEPVEQIFDDDMPYLKASWKAAYRYCTAYLQSMLPESTNITYDLITMRQWDEARIQRVLQPIIGTAEWLRPDIPNLGQERYPTITLKADGSFEKGEYTERAPGNFVFRCVARFEP